MSVNLVCQIAETEELHRVFYPIYTRQPDDASPESRCRLLEGIGDV